MHAEHDGDRDQRGHADALGVPGSPRSRGRRPTRARGRQPHAQQRQQREPEARPAEVGERLRHVAVRVADDERAGAEAVADRRVGAGAGADPAGDPVDVDRLLPVARAHGRRRGQPVGRVRRRLASGFGELVPGLGDLAVDARPAALASATSASDGASYEHRRAASAPAGACALRRRAAPRRGSRPRARARAARPASPGCSAPSSWPASSRTASGSLSVVSPVVRERPEDQRRGARRRAEEADRAAQPQRHDGEPDDEPDRQREQRAARVGEHQHELEQRDARPGERVDRRAARAAGAEPEQRRDARARPSARRSSSSRTARAAARRSPSSASHSGKTLVSSAQPQTTTQASAIAVQHACQRPGASRASAIVAAKAIT